MREIEWIEAAVSTWAEARTTDRGARDAYRHRAPGPGPLVVSGLPVKLSATPGSVRKVPPMVGEDNDRIYGELLGFTPTEIAELRASGAI